MHHADEVKYFFCPSRAFHWVHLNLHAKAPPGSNLPPSVPARTACVDDPSRGPARRPRRLEKLSLRCGTRPYGHQNSVGAAFRAGFTD